MNKYEMTYLTLQEENHNAGTVSGILAEHEAKIVAVHPWGARRKLVYPIQKQDQAFYTTVVFEAEPSKLQAIERATQLSTGVVRSLIVHYTPGFFDREVRSNDDTRSDSKREAKPAAAIETDTVTETPEAEKATDAEVKPKRKRAVKAEASPEEQQALDEKLTALLNEDITK